MVKRPEKERAIQYICDSLEDSGLYTIQNKSKNHESALIRRYNEETGNITNIEVIMANFLSPVKEYTDRVDHNSSKGTFTCPVLYKDRKTAFVRIRDTSKSWNSLIHNYTGEQIHRMLSLRKIESTIMNHLGENLIYYQPKSDRLEEKIIEYQMQPVWLEYSHVDINDPKKPFLRDGYSETYKLPQENRIIEPAARFKGIKGRWIAKLAPATIDPVRLLNPEDCQKELLENANNAYSNNFSPEQALEYYHPDN